MGSHQSWLERAMDLLKPRPEPPQIRALPIEPSAWRQAVEETHVVPGLTVHDIGLSVFGETRSFRDRPGSNEPPDTARQKVAHAIINDAELSVRTGNPRKPVHAPVEPQIHVLLNPIERAAYESSLRAAREAYLSGHDQTGGAIYLNTRPTSDRSNRRFKKGSAEGVALSTQSGPYDNSFPTREVPRTIWLNTYFPDENDKKMRKKR